MKKFIYTIASFAALLPLLTSCEKELMDYEGKECIYFDVRRSAPWLDQSTWPHQFFSEAAFGRVDGSEIDLSMKVMATGPAKDYDRPFSVEVVADSTTAVEGRDYFDLTKNCVIKANESFTYVTMKVKKTVEMEDDTLKVQLRLVANEHFELNFKKFGDWSMYGNQPDEGVYPHGTGPEFYANKDASMHNIFLYDVLVMPGGWWGGIFGNFSAKKFRLMMELCPDSPLSAYEDNQKTMPTARANSISQRLAEYLIQHVKDHDPILEVDGTMMWCNTVASLAPAYGISNWGPNVKPEDYYKQ